MSFRRKEFYIQVPTFLSKTILTLLGETLMTYGFIVFYRFQLMTPEQAGKAKEFWDEFGKGSWPEHLKLIGDYKHAWGSDWSGFLLIETEDPQSFFEFWPIFRDKTRFYIENTRTIVAIKRDPKDWM